MKKNIGKYGKEEYDVIFSAFNNWVQLAKEGLFSYCRIVAQKV